MYINENSFLDAFSSGKSKSIGDRISSLFSFNGWLANFKPNKDKEEKDPVAEAYEKVLDEKIRESERRYKEEYNARRKIETNKVKLKHAQEEAQKENVHKQLLKTLEDRNDFLNGEITRYKQLKKAISKGETIPRDLLAAEIDSNNRYIENITKGLPPEQRTAVEKLKNAQLEMLYKQSVGPDGSPLYDANGDPVYELRNQEEITKWAEENKEKAQMVLDAQRQGNENLKNNNVVDLEQLKKDCGVKDTSEEIKKAENDLIEKVDKVNKLDDIQKDIQSIIDKQAEYDRQKKQWDDKAAKRDASAEKRDNLKKLSDFQQKAFSYIKDNNEKFKNVAGLNIEDDDSIATFLANINDINSLNEKVNNGEKNVTIEDNIDNYSTAKYEQSMKNADNKYSRDEIAAQTVGDPGEPPKVELTDDQKNALKENGINVEAPIDITSISAQLTGVRAKASTDYTAAANAVTKAAEAEANISKRVARAIQANKEDAYNELSKDLRAKADALRDNPDSYKNTLIDGIEKTDDNGKVYIEDKDGTRIYRPTSLNANGEDLEKYEATLKTQIACAMIKGDLKAPQRVIAKKDENGDVIYEYEDGTQIDDVQRAAEAYAKYQVYIEKTSEVNKKLKEKLQNGEKLPDEVYKTIGEINSPGKQEKIRKMFNMDDKQFDALLSDIENRSNDDEWEDVDDNETDTGETDDDLEDDESDKKASKYNDPDEPSKKLVNPKTVWKRRKNKRTGRLGETYYKVGSNWTEKCSKDDYKEKIRVFKEKLARAKAKKEEENNSKNSGSTGATEAKESFNVSTYLKARLINEANLIQYLKK
jgi:hypothetical protein